jgi:hypothetical protein
MFGSMVQVKLRHQDHVGAIEGLVLFLLSGIVVVGDVVRGVVEEGVDFYHALAHVAGPFQDLWAGVGKEGV